VATDASRTDTQAAIIKRRSPIVVRIAVAPNERWWSATWATWSGLLTRK
jgi:hypothetical protein